MEKKVNNYTKKQILAGLLFAYSAVNTARGAFLYGGSVENYVVSGLFVVADLMLAAGLFMRNGQKLIRFGALMMVIAELGSFVQDMMFYGLYSPLWIVFSVFYIAAAFALYRFVSNAYSGNAARLAKAKKSWYIPAFCLGLVFVVEAAMSGVMMYLFVLVVAYLLLAVAVLEQVIEEDEKQFYNEVLVICCVAAVIILGVLFFVTDGPSSSHSDIAYDEDGFLGYSDGFWEWMRKQ